MKNRVALILTVITLSLLPALSGCADVSTAASDDKNQFATARDVIEADPHTIPDRGMF